MKGLPTTVAQFQEFEALHPNHQLQQLTDWLQQVAPSSAGKPQSSACIPEGHAIALERWLGQHVWVLGELLTTKPQEVAAWGNCLGTWLLACAGSFETLAQDRRRTLLYMVAQELEVYPQGGIGTNHATQVESLTYLLGAVANAINLINEGIG